MQGWIDMTKELQRFATKGQPREGKVYKLLARFAVRERIPHLAAAPAIVTADCLRGRRKTGTAQNSIQCFVNWAKTHWTTTFDNEHVSALAGGMMPKRTGQAAPEHLVRRRLRGYQPQRGPAE